MTAIAQLRISTTLGDVPVIAREPNSYTSTFPSEILTCRLPDGREIRILRKSAGGVEHNAWGHRGGVSYEAMVYREVLSRSAMSLPKFYGSGVEDDELLIEFIEDAKCADEAQRVEDAMAAAARWIGRFHAEMEGLEAPLNRYDAAYYRMWPRRTAELAGFWHERLPWLAQLCRGAEEYCERLEREPLTIIHGEYTPRNVLLRDGQAYPIDWESAAIAIGEIDLVCLTDKWPAQLALRCEEHYRLARWPCGAPSDFETRLNMARLYWNFRWLGDRPEWSGTEKVGPRFESLRNTAMQLGLL